VPASAETPAPLMNIFIRQTRQRDRQRTDYMHKKSKKNTKNHGSQIVYFGALSSSLEYLLLHCTPCPRKKQATLIIAITSPSVEIFLQFLKHFVQE